MSLTKYANLNAATLADLREWIEMKTEQLLASKDVSLPRNTANTISEELRDRITARLLIINEHGVITRRARREDVYRDYYIRYLSEMGEVISYAPKRFIIKSAQLREHFLNLMYTMTCPRHRTSFLLAAPQGDRQIMLTVNDDVLTFDFAKHTTKPDLNQCVFVKLVIGEHIRTVLRSRNAFTNYYPEDRSKFGLQLHKASLTLGNLDFFSETLVKSMANSISREYAKFFGVTEETLNVAIEEQVLEKRFRIYTLAITKEHQPVTLLKVKITVIDKTFYLEV